MATNNDQILSSLLAALEGLRKEVAELKGAQASSKPARKSSTPSASSDPEKKERKPREPTSWDTFRAKVQAALSEGGLKANAMSYASHLKNTYEDAYTWDTDAIIAAFPDYTPPEPKPRKPKSKSEDDEAEAEAKPKKPRKPMTEEHKAKLQAGAAAYRARLKAEKEAAQASQAEAEASPKASSPKPAPVKLTPLPFRGKRLVWDPATNGTWIRGPDADDGSLTKGAWFGILGADKKSVDTNASDPEA